MGRVAGIAESEANCERLIRQMEQDGEPIELTRSGKVVGILRRPDTPAQAAASPASIFGMLRSDTYRFEEAFAPACEPGEWHADMRDSSHPPS